MSNFIKLSNLIINKNYIQTIAVKPNKYYINIMTNTFDGSNWMIAGSGVGSIASYHCEIEICETKHSNDYKIISDWINNQK